MAVVGTPLRTLAAVALLACMILRAGSTVARPFGTAAVSSARSLVRRRGQMYRRFMRRMRRLVMHDRVRLMWCRMGLMRHRARLVSHGMRLMRYRMGLVRHGVRLVRHRSVGRSVLVRGSVLHRRVLFRTCHRVFSRSVRHGVVRLLVSDRFVRDRRARVGCVFGGLMLSTMCGQGRACRSGADDCRVTGRYDPGSMENARLPGRCDRRRSVIDRGMQCLVSRSHMLIA